MLLLCLELLSPKPKFGYGKGFVLLYSKSMRYRLTTLFAALAFLVVLGIILFLIAGTIHLPSIWLYLGLRVAFTFVSVFAMSEDVARERLKPGKGAKPEPVYNIGTTIAWSPISSLPRSIWDGSTGAWGFLFG